MAVEGGQVVIFNLKEKSLDDYNPVTRSRAMKLYLISQNDNCHYDTYDSAVVAAPDEETAKHMNPHTGEQMTELDWRYPHGSNWCDAPEKVSVRYIGEAAADVEQGVVCAS